MAEAGVRVPMDQVKMSAISDERVDFMREQAFTVLRLKTDKWNRFIGLEENQRALLDFLDQGWREFLILFVGPGGTLHTGDEQVSRGEHNTQHSLTFSVCVNLLSVQSISISLHSFHMANRIVWFCFINRVYTFFFNYPERVEVKCDTFHR